MKIIKQILAVCVILGLIYLAFYAVQDLRTRSADGKRSDAVQQLREEKQAMVTPEVAQPPAEVHVEEPEATEAPTEAPTVEPEVTEASTEAPTVEPEVTEVSTEAPTVEPEVTEASTEAPTVEPEVTEAPTEAPTVEPEVTEASTEAPTAEPEATAVPTEVPTEEPEATDAPTEAPAATQAPSPVLTEAPTAKPTSVPTAAPTAEPTPDPLLLYYDELHAQNEEMVGWIYVEGTVIDYPVMYTPEDEEFYLHKNFEKKYSFAGTPFIDARCVLDPRCDNVIIYAHNMKNGTMFGQLSKYLESDFFEEYPFISYDTLTERGEYLVFAVIPVYMGKMDDERMRCYGTSMTEDENQVQMLYEYLDDYAVYVRDEALPEAGDKIVTLSTCTGYRDADRLVVMAVKID